MKEVRAGGMMPGAEAHAAASGGQGGASGAASAATRTSTQGQAAEAGGGDGGGDGAVVKNGEVAQAIDAASQSFLSRPASVAVKVSMCVVGGESRVGGVGFFVV